LVSLIDSYCFNITSHSKVLQKNRTQYQPNRMHCFQSLLSLEIATGKVYLPALPAGIHTGASNKLRRLNPDRRQSRPRGGKKIRAGAVEDVFVGLRFWAGKRLCW
jgi:hypothetical protein